MRMRSFGIGGPSVSVVGQGTWPVPDRDALRRGFALGLTHVDTAEMYGGGRSEEIVGEAIAGVPREMLFLVSKVIPSNATAGGIVRACEGSLRRLRTEYLDCYLLHWRGDGPLDEAMGGLARLLREGKIRSLGVSNLDPWDLREAAAAVAGTPIVCDQVLYHLGERTVEDHELPWCREHGAALVAYTPLGQPTLEAADAGARVLVEIAGAHGATVHAVALAFLLRDPSAFVIPKANRPEHVEANAVAGDLVLAPDEIAAIDAAYPKRRRTGPLPMN